MNTRVALGIATTVACAAAWMVACDGGTADSNDASAPSGDDASTSSNNNNSSGNDTSFDAGSSNIGVDAGDDSQDTDDAGATDSGSTNLSEIDGGEPSTPGFVACVTPAKFDCATTTSFCCTTTEKDGGKEGVCDLDNVKCQNNAVEEHCDEAADCDGGGSVCCAGNLGKGTVCEATCKNAIQYCRTDKECAADAGCSVLTCNGTPAEVCGHPAGCK